jgi:SAM-dependent methyltransferase
MKPSDTIKWRADERSCPICGTANAQKLGERGGCAHRTGKGVKTSVVRCRKCQVLYTKPTLTPESNPYADEPPETYFQHHDYKQKILVGEELAAFAEKILGKTGTMLELGCGRGELLVGAANRGWTVRGVEMTQAYAQIAKDSGMDVEFTSIENCKSLTGTYDVILMSAILEHLYWPLETLKQVGNALRPGGLLYIDVPNESSLAARMGNLYMKLQGRSWVVNLSPTFPPFHVVGFSPGSLRYTLNSIGFRVHTLHTLKWNNAYPKAKSIVHVVERSALGCFQSIGALLGMGDGIKCWAIKEY